MSQTVDVGIDFGTTNSVLAVMTNGHVQVLKNEGESDTTPTFVAADKFGELFVGEPAVSFQLTDPENVAQGFKRQLGRSDTWQFPNNGSTYTAEALASAVLRELRAIASSHFNEDTTGAVISVPAAFGEVEKYALARAAKAAGFRQTALVQEPIAAGLAYGWDHSDSDRPFLVYDLGGGTFDLSLVQIVSGQLVVRAHLGEPTLGGRDLDSLILDELVLPKLPGNTDHASFRAARSVLLYLCERAKIRLSRFPTATVALGGRLRTTTGTAIEDVVVVTREEYEPLVLPLVKRTVALTHQLLEQAHVKLSDLTSVVLVGGPSRTPILRDALENALDVAIETKIDPMTVVAQGAALFSASIQKESVPGASKSVAGSVNLQFEYEPVTDQAVVPVGIMADGRPEDVGILRLHRKDGQWEGGLIELRNGRAMTRVVLAEDRQSTFEVEMFDKSGARVSAMPSSFSVVRGLSAAAPPLSRSIGVLVERLNEPTIDVLARKGDPTPIAKRVDYRTTKALAPVDGDAIELAFFEGSPSGTDSVRPDRWRLIGVVPVYGHELQSALPSNSDIQVTIRVGQSSEASAQVYIPSFNLTLSNKLEIGMEAVPDPVELRVKLASKTQRVTALREGGTQMPSFESTLSNVSHEINLAIEGDRDGSSRAVQALDNLEDELNALEEKEAPRLAFMRLADFEKDAAEMASDLGEEADRQALRDLQTRAQQARDLGDATVAQAVSEAFLNFYVSVYWKQPGAWVNHFRDLVSQDNFVQPERARSLIEQGRRALEMSDFPVLKSVVIELNNLAPRKTSNGAWEKFMGLTRTGG